jgi:glutamate 5-kinase
MSDSREIIVVKYGSSSVTDEGGVDHERLAGYAEQLAGVHQFYDLFVVTSGAIAVGNAMWPDMGHKGSADERAQILAMVGAPHMSIAWQRAFNKHGIQAGQALVTHREIDEPQERSMLKKVLATSRQVRFVPVFNENDALSNKEIAALSYGGENDGLASHIARVVGARQLLLLTEVVGLFDGYQLVKTVDSEQDEVRAKIIAGMSSNSGRGGMRTKVEAALVARKFNVEVHIASANARIADVLDGKVGTTFPAQQKLHGSPDAVEYEI